EAALLEEFQRVEVVALDEQVPGLVEVDAVGPGRTQGVSRGGVGGGHRGALARPVEVVPLARPVDGLPAQLAPEQVEIDRRGDGTVGPLGFDHATRKHLAYPLDVAGGLAVRRCRDGAHAAAYRARCPRIASTAGSRPRGRRN